MSDTDFAPHAVAVATSFWGDPNKSLTTPKKAVWGSQGGRSVSIEKGTWFDYEKQLGGGVIDLVMNEMGCDKPEALAWLQGEGFIEGRDAHQPPARAAERPSPPPADEPPFQPDQPPAEPGRKTMVKGYDYTDRDGNKLYQVVRFQWKLPDGSWVIDPKTGNPKKTFAQRRRDAAGNEVWNLEGVAHTIYRHPQVEIAIAEGKPILLVEGEKDVETVEPWGWTASTNSGGAKHWSAPHAEVFRGADVVILVDNDDAGREGGELRAKSLRGIAKRVRFLDFSMYVPGFMHKGDVSDWAAAGGTAEQLAAIIGQLPDYRPRPPASKFNAMAVKDAGKASQLHEWLVQDLIELHGTAAFSGYSQSGKSFQMIELAFAVALGRKFWGRPVKQGLVVYQLGEGEEGFMKRLEGYLKDRGIEDPSLVPIVILPKKINLFQSDDDATALIAEAKAWEAYWDMPLRMIVIDTYNKATRGANEISGQDIGKINDRIERIVAECHCNVTVVDHLSKGGTVRGHGSKTDDVTNMIRVEKDEKKVDRNGRPIRRMRLDKNKDGENGGVIEFVLRQVVVGFKDDGTAITTCVVEAPHGSEEELEKSGRLPLNQSLILQTIRDVIAREGTEAPAGIKDVPKGKHVAPWKAIVTELRRKWIYKAAENEPEQRERELQRIVADAGKRLQVNGYIDRDNTAGVVWWTGKTDRPLFKPKPVEEPGAGVSEALKKEIADMDLPF